MAVAIAADQSDIFTHALQQGQGADEGFFVAADHDAQGASLGADFTARHRRVEVLRAFGVDFFGEGFGRSGRDRTHIDHHFVRAQACSNPVFTEQDFVDLRGVGHHDDDEFGFLSDFFRAGQGDGASRQQVARCCAAMGRQEQAVPGLLQVAGHRRTHDPGADKSDFSHDKSSCFY